MFNIIAEEENMDYKRLAKVFFDTHNVNPHILLEIISRFPSNSQIRVLDFGCGTGNYIKKISTYTNYKIYGVEPCEEMILYAQEQNPNIIIRQGNHLSIPYPNNFFDFIYMTNVVHQIPDISNMYKELHRVLKTNGVLCICTENRRQLLSKYWIRFFPSIIIKDLQRFPSISKLKKIAINQNFTIIKTIVISEKKWCHITNFVLSQMLRRSMSVLQLISDKQYFFGIKRMKNAQKHNKIYFSNRGYTFIWLKAEDIL